MIDKNRLKDSFILLLLLITFFSVPKGADKEVIWCCLLIFYYYFFTLANKPVIIFKSIPTYFKIELFFLVFYYLLFYLPYQSYVLGYTDISQNLFVSNTFVEYTNISIVASTIGLVSFILGFRTNIKLKKSIEKITITSRINSDRTLVILFILLLVLGGIFIQTGLTQLLVKAYAASDTGDKTTNGVYFLMSHFVSVSMSFVVIYYVTYKKINILMIINILIGVGWCLILLITGDRNTFFIIGVASMAGIYTFLKPISKKMILLYMTGALVLYQVVEVSRKSDNKGLGAIADAASSGSASEKSLDESSFTITTVTSRAAFALVPERYDFFYGKFKLIGFAGIIPYSRTLIVDPKDRILTSSDLFVLGILGRDATWGVGSNVISDIYVDFGIIGVVVLMYILGWFGKFMETKVKCNPNSIVISVLYLVILALYAEMPRYTYDFPVRNIAWTLYLFFFVRIFYVKKYEKSL